MYAIVAKRIYGIGATPFIAAQNARKPAKGAICVPCTERLATMFAAHPRVKFDMVAGIADIRWTGKDLRAWREERGWSRTALGARLGISPEALLNWENGKRRDTGKKAPVPLYIRLACERLDGGPTCETTESC